MIYVLLSFWAGVTLMCWCLTRPSSQLKIEEYKDLQPRRFRKWEHYEKKNEWVSRYMKYLHECKKNDRRPYYIPYHRVYDIDPEKKKIIESIYDENITKQI